MALTGTAIGPDWLVFCEPATFKSFPANSTWFDYSHAKKLFPSKLGRTLRGFAYDIPQMVLLPDGKEYMKIEYSL